MYKINRRLLAALTCALSTNIAIATNQANSSEEREPDAKRASILLDTKSDWSGAVLPGYPTAQPKITVVKGVIRPGEVAPMHQHPVIGVYYVLRGKLTVRTESGQTLNATEGHAYAEVVNQWHWGKNESDKDVELIFVYVGAEGMMNNIPQK